MDPSWRTKAFLLDVFDRLYRAFGPMHWWPAEDPFEVMVGAVLTQNTSWGNVAKVIARLKEKGLMGMERLHGMEAETLAEEIRSCGYYRQKALRLKGLVDFVMENYDGDLQRMFSEELASLRSRLLALYGIGPETADSILLYAGEKPIFVIDAYTKRILSRHGLVEEGIRYEALQKIFMENLPEDAVLFNEYHALLVHTAKQFCRKVPRCEGCPMEGLFFSR